MPKTEKQANWQRDGIRLGLAVLIGALVLVAFLNVSPRWSLLAKVPLIGGVFGGGAVSNAASTPPDQ